MLTDPHVYTFHIVRMRNDNNIIRLRDKSLNQVNNKRELMTNF